MFSLRDLIFSQSQPSQDTDEVDDSQLNSVSQRLPPYLSQSQLWSSQPSEGISGISKPRGIPIGDNYLYDDNEEADGGEDDEEEEDDDTGRKRRYLCEHAMFTCICVHNLW